jgi:hypothetical protein
MSLALKATAECSFTAFNGEVARGGTVEQPFQLDTPVLKDTTTGMYDTCIQRTFGSKSSSADPCGATLIGGSVNIAMSMTAVSQAFGGVPTIPSDGTLTMGVFQVNADGGGPFAAEINTDATGAKWTAIKVVSQPPGVNGILHNGPANSSITVQVPTGTACTGGSDSATCLIRLNNGGQTASLANGAGPFGGCVAVSQVDATTTGAATAATSKSGKSKSAAKKSARFLNGRHFYPNELSRRVAVQDMVEKRLSAALDEGLANLLEKRASIEREIVEKRQFITTQLLDEISTATGTAIDMPIDRLAGHEDTAVNGGNSTAAASSGTSTLTTQQAVDLKKAVQLAITQAITLLANTQVDAGAGGQSSVCCPFGSAFYEPADHPACRQSPMRRTLPPTLPRRPGQHR